MASGHEIVISTIFCSKCSWIMMPTEAGFYECHNAECPNCLRQWKIVQIIMEEVRNVSETNIPGVQVG